MTCFVVAGTRPEAGDGISISKGRFIRVWLPYPLPTRP
jgi:hypothetical protein